MQMCTNGRKGNGNKACELAPSEENILDTPYSERTGDHIQADWDWWKLLGVVARPDCLLVPVVKLLFVECFPEQEPRVQLQYIKCRG